MPDSPSGPVPGEASRAAVEGRELEFILRSLLELKLQVEELRRRLDGAGDGGVLESPGPRGFIGEVVPPVGRAPSSGGGTVGAIGPRDEIPLPNVVTIVPGTRMTEVERAVIEAALKETRGNRRQAADLLGIGERTLYRKIKEYRLPELEYQLD